MHVINTIKVGASVPNEKVAGGYQTTTATSKECTPIFPRSEGEGNIQPMHLPQQARQVGVPVAKHGRAQEKGFAASTAALTGESVRSIQRSIRQAEILGDDLDRIIGTSLDKGVELDALIKLSEPDRKELIGRAQSGGKVSAVKALKATADDEFYVANVRARTLHEFHQKLRRVTAIVEWHLAKKGGAA
jgi:hypothetical protein